MFETAQFDLAVADANRERWLRVDGGTVCDAAIA